MSQIPCPRCGVPLPAEARFCLQCGAAIGEAADLGDGASTKAFDVPPDLLERSKKPVEATVPAGSFPPGTTTSALHATVRPTISSYTRPPWVLYAVVGVVVVGGAAFLGWKMMAQEAVVASPPLVTIGAPIPVPGAPTGTAAPGLPVGEAIPGTPGSAGVTAAGTGPRIGTAAAAGNGTGTGAGGAAGSGTAAAAAAATGPGTAAGSSAGGGGAVEAQGAAEEEAGGGEGFISPAAVSRVMAFYVPRVRSCYERVLRNEPGVRGTVQVRFTVNGSGNVSRADVMRNTTGSEALASCVTGQMRTWRFPAAEGGDAVFEYPFRFGGGGGGEEESGLALPGATED